MYMYMYIYIYVLLHIVPDMKQHSGPSSLVVDRYKTFHIQYIIYKESLGKFRYKSVLVLKNRAGCGKAFWPFQPGS